MNKKFYLIKLQIYKIHFKKFIHALLLGYEIDRKNTSFYPHNFFYIYFLISITLKDYNIFYQQHHYDPGCHLPGFESC